MALTMTRTRTQTALTRLAERVAKVHGELEVVEGLLRVGEAKEEARDALEARRLKLVANRDALYATIRQFDPEIDPSGIGVAQGWEKKNGSRPAPVTSGKR